MVYAFVIHVLDIGTVSGAVLISAGVMVVFFFFQAEDGIRDLVRSRGLGDVYKRQVLYISENDMCPSNVPSIK